MTDVKTLTLADFLLARIDEDEVFAMCATRGTWRFAEDHEWRGVGNIECQTAPLDVSYIAHDNDREEGVGAVDIENAAHMVRWQPDRVLAECEAKRQIVAEHVHQYHGKKIPSYTEKLECETCAKHGYTESYGEVWRSGELWPCDTLRFLAAIYADHPDYRDEWRTDGVA